MQLLRPVPYQGEVLWPHARPGTVYSEFDSLLPDQFVVAQQSERQFEKLGVVGATPTGETTWSVRIAAIAGGCKPSAFGLREFESLTLHQMCNRGGMATRLIATQSHAGSSPV